MMLLKTDLDYENYIQIASDIADALGMQKTNAKPFS